MYLDSILPITFFPSASFQSLCLRSACSYSYHIFSLCQVTTLSLTIHNSLTLSLRFKSTYSTNLSSHKLSSGLRTDFTDFMTKPFLQNKVNRQQKKPSTLDELREDSNEKLFSSSRYNPNRVLHRLLPQPKNTGHNLCQRKHNLILPTDVNAVVKQNFVVECYFETSISCIMFYVLLLFCLHFVIFHSSDLRTIVYLLISLHFTFHCMLHVRLSYFN